jgi:hypothetical protein
LFDTVAGSDQRRLRTPKPGNPSSFGEHRKKETRGLREAKGEAKAKAKAKAEAKAKARIRVKARVRS